MLKRHDKIERKGDEKEWRSSVVGRVTILENARGMISY